MSTLVYKVFGPWNTSVADLLGVRALLITMVWLIMLLNLVVMARSQFQGFPIPDEDGGNSISVILNGVPVELCRGSSCVGRCGQTTVSNYGACFCDDTCLFYGDCCFDYESMCQGSEGSWPSSNNTFEQSKDLELREASYGVDTLECVQYGPENDAVHVWTRNKCPANIDEPLMSLVSRCEENNGTEPEIILVIEDIVYKNIFCAMCNGHLNPTLDASDYDTINVPDNASACGITNTSNETSKREFVDNCRVFAEMWILYIEPFGHQDCSAVAISTCDGRLQNTLANYTETETSCKAYKSLVTSNETGRQIVFRNPHCALCNGVTEYSCFHTFSNPTYWSQFPTLQVLLKVVPKREKLFVGQSEICIAGTIYDVEKSSCIVLNCPEGEKTFANRCVPFIDPSPQLISANASEVYSLLTVWRMNPPMAVSALTAVLQHIVSSHIYEIIPAREKDFRLSFGNIPLSGSQDFSKFVDLFGAMENGSSTEFSFNNGVFVTFRFELAYSFDIHMVISQRSRELDQLKAAFDALEFADLHGLYLVGFDILESSLSCGDNGILVEEKDFVIAHNNFQILSLLPPDIFVNRTSQTYASTQAPIVLTYYSSGQEMQQQNIALICEAPIFSCANTNIKRDSYHIQGKILMMSHDKNPTPVDEGSYIVLPSGEAIICVSALQAPKTSKQHIYIQGVTTLVGNILSVICLAFTLLSYTCLEPLRSLPGKAMINLCISLGLAQLLFQLSPVFESIAVVCTVVSASEHYLWLVVFAWMNVLAFDASRRFSRKVAVIASSKAIARRFKAYFLYAWGVPLLPVITCIALQELTELPVNYISADDGSCWLGNSTTRLGAFGMPILVIICVNIGFYTHTIVSIRQSYSSTVDVLDKREDVVIYIKLSVIMGFTWIFGFLANVNALVVMEYLFVVFNSLQGAFIFFSFIFNSRVYRMWKSYVSGRKIFSCMTSKT